MNRVSLGGVLLSLLGLTLAAPAAAQIDAPPPLEILYGFTLIDGRGGPPLEDAALAIRGNEIVTVSSRRELLSGPNAPVNAVAINLGGGYVVPGLVDAHVHLATAPNRPNAEAELHRMLYAGITAVRDMAGDARSLASLARDSRLGVIDAPDVYYSALMAGPSFFDDPRPRSAASGEEPGETPWMQAITPETDVTTAVARAIGTSASGIKIYANLEAAEVARITEEAHRQGTRVWAHSMVFPARPLEVVRAGVDVVSHVCRIAWEAMEDAPAEYHHDQTPRFGTFTANSQVFRELYEEMRRHGTILDATLSMYARTDSIRRVNPDAAPRERCDTDFARSLVAQAHAEGIPIAAGTDYSAAASDPFPALHREVEELVGGAGLSPMEAIVAATRVAAEAAGVEDRHGTLQHGRPVNFVLLAQNPLEDIGNLRTVRSVWKNAKRFDRAAYRPVVADSEGGSSTTATQGATSAQEALARWLQLWRRYDIARLDEVFLEDASLTYYASDGQGVLEGFDAVVEHHRQVGFVPGGFQPERELWLEDTLIADFEDSVVVTGVWYLGNRVARQGAGRGPLTMVLLRTEAGYKISHLHLGNYPRER